MNLDIENLCVFCDVCNCGGVCCYFAHVDEDDEFVAAYSKKLYTEFVGEWMEYVSEYSDGRGDM